MLSKIYEPQKYEDEIYKEWEESGYFNPDNLESDEKYANIMPPPNANGELHLGHASGYTVMDLFGRFQRMLGKKTLLLPGKDHAGIQTQVVYERKIKEERGVSRKDLGREKFYQEVYDFCIDRSQYMRNQEKKMGLSADWSREKFTLDPQIVDIVLDTFVKMYHEVDAEGNRMIYRGERIINWCPRCASALSDYEVEHKESKAKIYTFRYDKDFPFPIATTRPETKLGDTAVAVNPKDDRYKQYIGKTFKVNFCSIPLELKVVSDEEIDMNFGTGAVGVTPAHSMADWEIAKKNNLKSIKVINEDNKILEGFGEFSGKQVSEVRELVVKKLRKNNLIEKEEEIDNNLSVCERCKTAIEPLISKQWFVNVDHENFSLKKEARKVVENEEIKIYPQNFRKIMLQWIDNVHDWCISRQIWWGPQIPAWYKEGEMKVQKESPGEDWQQDGDTFDTWFSSGQWPYTTLGYPDQKDFRDFYTTDTMIMGRDILSFWSFRMIILGLYRTRQIPFRNLYFTGLIRDEHGQKMSKSKGNGIEPLEMIEKYGTDAVRLSLIIGSAPGNDLNLGEAKIEKFRNFINKLWNISRFIEGNFEIKDQDKEINIEDLSSADIWVLEKLDNLVKSTTENLVNYKFGQAGEDLIEFSRDHLADWYLEAAKFEENKETKNLIFSKILKNLLKLWHPFIPFVTEKIWQTIFSDEKFLMIANWPSREDLNLDLERSVGSSEFDQIQEIIISIRNARAENKIEPNRKVAAIIVTSSNNQNFLSQNKNLIIKLRTGISEISFQENNTDIDQDAIKVIVGEIEIYLLGAIDKEKEEQRIQKEKENLEKLIKSLEGKLANQDFISKAPEDVVVRDRKNLEKYKSELERLNI